MQSESRSRSYRFGAGSDGNSLLTAGWGEPERGFVWTEGKMGTLQIPVPAGSHTVSFSMWGYVTENTPVQEVLIFANGQLKGLFCVKDKVIFPVVVETADSGKGLELCFYIPTAISPKRAENSTDERCLGIALALIQIQSAPLAPA